MPTPKASGTQAATGGEDSLTTITDPGNYLLNVDMNAMVAGDAVVLRAYTRVLAGGADREVAQEVFAGAQTPPIVPSIPFSSPHQIQFTLEQVDGSLRSFPWEVIEVSS